MNRLRTLEATALLATVLAFGLTALLVPASAATEANGAAATLLATIGWAGAGVLAVVLEGAFFVGYGRMHRAGYPRAALGGGAVVALLGVGALAWNLRVLVELGLPETINAGRYGFAVEIVATAAASVYLRAELRVVAEMLVYALGDVTSWLSKGNARTVAICLLVVISMFSGSITHSPNGISPVGTATAAEEWAYNKTIDVSGQMGGAIYTASDGQNKYVGDNGDIIYEYTSGWSYTGNSYDLSQTGAKDVVWNGSHWIVFDTVDADAHVYTSDFSYTGKSFTLQVSGNNPDSLEGATFTGDKWYIVINEKTQGNTKEIGEYDTNFNFVENVTTGLTNDNNSPNGVAYQGGNLYSGNTGSGSVYKYDTSGTLQSTIDISTNSDGGNEISFFDGRFQTADYVDATVRLWSADTGVTVSGSLTDANDNGISSGAVELRQSGSVVKSTTTASDGSYSLSGVSSGDYTLVASADGYQSKETTISVADSPVTADLTLFESGTFEREFQLDEQASQTYPPSKSTLHVYRFDRAIEFPLPGGTTFKAGPGDWKKIESTQFNGFGTATTRLTNGEPYRVEVVATSGERSTRWESLGWRADQNEPDPFLISVGELSDSSTATPTPTTTGTPGATPTATATPTGTDGVDYGDLTPPTDPFDLDDDGQYFDEPDGSGGNVTAPSGGTGFGPRLAGDCLIADGTSGVLIEYWDPAYQTTELDYNLSAGNNSYAGDRTFDTPAGYASWCVADTLTNNASDATTDLRGNLTRNGTTTNFSDTLSQSSVFGGPIGGGGGGGEPSTGQQVVGIGLSAGVGYLLVRRFTEFRLSEAASTIVERLPVGGGRS